MPLSRQKKKFQAFSQLKVNPHFLHLTTTYGPSSNCCAKFNQWSKMMFTQTQRIFRSSTESLPFASISTTKVMSPLKISYFLITDSDFILGSDIRLGV